MDNVDFQITFAFFVLAFGGLVIEILSIWQSDKKMGEEDKKRVQFTRGTAILVLFFGLLASAFHIIAPQEIKVGALVILGVILLLSASSYSISVIRDKKYLYLTHIVESSLDHWRRHLVTSVIRESQNGLNLDKIVNESRRKGKNNLPEVPHLSAIGWNVIKEHAFQEYHFEEVLKKLEYDGDVEETNGEYKMIRNRGESDTQE